MVSGARSPTLAGVVQVLNVARDATSQQIRKAFRTQSLMLHPVRMCVRNAGLRRRRNLRAAAMCTPTGQSWAPCSQRCNWQ